jgi:hypothetical protein
MNLVRNSRILYCLILRLYFLIIILKIILCITASPNFISEIFFITLAMHHYGPLQCYNKYNNLNRELAELQKQYDRLKADQPKWAGVNINYYSIKCFVLNNKIYNLFFYLLKNQKTPTAAFNNTLLERCKV